MLGSLMKIIDPEADVEITREDMEDTQHTTSKFGRRVKKDVRPLLERHLHSETRIDVEDWIEALRATANRGGLLVCDRAEAALRVLASEAGYDVDQDPTVLKKLFQESSEVQDLLAYAVGSSFFKLREKIYFQ